MRIQLPKVACCLAHCRILSDLEGASLHRYVVPNIVWHSRLNAHERTDIEHTVAGFA